MMNEQIDIKDLIDFDEFQKLMEGFYTLTNIPIGVIDINNNILVATGWQKICTHFHRKNPETLKNCIESDHFFENNKSENDYIEYKCKNNLWDIAQPIYIENKHVATIYLGQFRYEDEIVDDNIFIEQARKYNFDPVEYLEALHLIPVFSREYIKKVMNYYKQLSKIITYTGYSNYKLKNEIIQKTIIQEELLKSKEKAEEANRLKTEFLNNMSHEIRTPMNGIIGFSDLLDETDISIEKRKYYTKIIQNSSNQLLRIIDDILEISTLETKQQKIYEEPLCLNDLIMELFSVFTLRSKEQNIPIYVKKALPDNKSHIISDPIKLNKILSNLIENALKFTLKGFIEIGYYIENSKLLVYVKDTGVGISTPNLQVIFERFAQEEKKISQKHGGLGLGLSIAKENAQLLGGDITLVSEKGKGSTFTITIPYKPDNNNYTNSTAIETKKGHCNNILIAEDEEVNYLYIEAIFEQQKDINYNLIHAIDGTQAVDICMNTKDIDLVLMDIKMPGMNGYEATEKIKAIRPNLPIIAQTAYSTEMDRELALKHGCCDFISKPLNKDKLFELINKFISLKQPHP